MHCHAFKRASVRNVRSFYATVAATPFAAATAATALATTDLTAASIASSA